LIAVVVDPSAPILPDPSNLSYSDIEILSNNNTRYSNGSYPLGLISIF